MRISPTRFPMLLAAALALALAGPAPGQTPETAPAPPPEAAPDAALPEPVAVADNKAPVTTASAVFVPQLGRSFVRLAFPEPDETPVLGETLNATAHKMLKDLYKAGKAAGNHGDLYDNRDRGHSTLPPENHPQITRVIYDETARAEGLDYGLGDRLLFDAPTLGNSSTALTGEDYWRSQPRFALTGGDGTGPLRLFQNYAANQIYFYPEHRDHDEKYGDLIPANTPYMLISQGSSGSDRAHMEAVAMIMAAFKPETKAFLVENGLIAPTVQMVYRRSQTTVLSRAAYFSGLAHPSVFPARVINLARMVALANAIEPGNVPPMVLLEVVEEDEAVEGVDYFGSDLSERFFDTPSAIARIWRSSAYSRSMVVSAAATKDPTGRPQEFTWAVLRGDPERTRIEVLDAAGASARITIDWQNPRPVPGRPEISSNRVDIGVFANNGVYESAPAFISMLLPQHETRSYEAGPDGTMRIASIGYAPAAEAYVDPALFPRMEWRDAWAYDDAGALLGWTRTRNGFDSDYDATGARILSRDKSGRPEHVEIVSYGLSHADGLSRLEEASSGRFEDRSIRASDP
jgi:hypothetical protein